MGVMNITPNSFSDGGELISPSIIRERFLSFGPIDVLDVGAESTAPMNSSISWEEEWGRLRPYLALLCEFRVPISIDTYHTDTIKMVTRTWKDDGIDLPLIWNDVSGKFDHDVEEFLALNKNFKYVYCHNLAPTRELTGKHMSFPWTCGPESCVDELVAHFKKHIHPQVIFDPTLGFSKSYEQNWYLLENMGRLQEKVGHDQWVVGYSRKSFLRKRLGIGQIDFEARERLDQYHTEILNKLLPKLSGTVWVRTHRPELMSSLRFEF